MVADSALALGADRAAADERQSAKGRSVIAIPIIKSTLAALFSACAVASIAYSPMLVWAIVIQRYDWRMEMHGPQIRAVPGEIRWLVAIVFAILAIGMCIDVSAAYPKWKSAPRWACALGLGAGLVYWLFYGPGLF